MKITSTTFLATLTLLAASHPVTGLAKEISPMADCVTLSPDHQAARFGSQYLAIRDGDTHYRVEFGGSCAALQSASVVVTSDRAPNRLCATGSRVSSKAGDCMVSKVTVIDEAEFERYARRPRR
jgi:hypothetical protein